MDANIPDAYFDSQIRVAAWSTCFATVQLLRNILLTQLIPEITKSCDNQILATTKHFRIPSKCPSHPMHFVLLDNEMSLNCNSASMEFAGM